MGGGVNLERVPSMRKTFIFIAQIAAIQHVTVIMATVWKPTSAWRSSGVGTNFVLGSQGVLGGWTKTTLYNNE